MGIDQRFPSVVHRALEFRIAITKVSVVRITYDYHFSPKYSSISCFGNVVIKICIYDTIIIYYLLGTRYLINYCSFKVSFFFFAIQTHYYYYYDYYTIIRCNYYFTVVVHAIIYTWIVLVTQQQLLRITSWTNIVFTFLEYRVCSRLKVEKIHSRVSAEWKQKISLLLPRP